MHRRPAEHTDRPDETPKLAIESQQFAAAAEELDRKLGLSPEARLQIEMHERLGLGVGDVVGEDELYGAEIIKDRREQLASVFGRTVDGYSRQLSDFVRRMIQISDSDTEQVTDELDARVQTGRLLRASGRGGKTTIPWMNRLAA